MRKVPPFEGSEIRARRGPFRRLRCAAPTRDPGDLRSLRIDASRCGPHRGIARFLRSCSTPLPVLRRSVDRARSEEHTSELQSRGHLVCRLLLEKKKKQKKTHKRKEYTNT